MMDKIFGKAIATVDGGKIYIDTHLLNDDDPVARLSNRLHRYVVEAEDKALRAALIKLGWTPPDGKK
jgi:hypothetical protein